MDDRRRKFLVRLLAGAGMLSGLSRLSVRSAAAMGQHPQGVRKIEGSAAINGQPVQMGDIVSVGDTVTTGPDGTVIFVVEAAVFLLRESTRLTLTRDRIDESTSVDGIRLLKGKMLGVFSRRRRKRLLTPSAVVGIRGSGVYTEVDPETTYLCTCYGHAAIKSLAAPQNRESVTTRHHEAPRYIDAAGRIRPAPVVNHTDAELILLESLAGRRPPFVQSESHGY